MSRVVVVTGTDTGVGKTVFASALAGACAGSYWKPIEAGVEEGGDSRRALELSGLFPERVLPPAYRLTTPCSPHRAAEIDGVTIDPDALLLPDHMPPLIIEGAGGVLVPVTRALSFIDLFARWGAPVVLVARTTLGTINHSLLSIALLKQRGIRILGVAFVGPAEDDGETTICALGEVKRLGRLPWLDPLNRECLAEQFQLAFDLADFPL